MRRKGKATIIQGDVLERLAEMEAGTVQCAMTSPPYFALRSYLPKDHPDKALEIGSEGSVVEERQLKRSRPRDRTARMLVEKNAGRPGAKAIIV